MSIWRTVPLLVFLALVFFLWRGLSLNPHELPSTQIGQSVPDHLMPVLGDASKTFSLKSAHGHYFLLNVWGSWCAACIEEQVFLLQLSRKGIPIYGINYKDNAQKASEWLVEWGNPFTTIAFDPEGQVGMDLGVYGAPETFLVDARGIIQYRHVGVLDEMSWQKEFVPRIRHAG